MFCSNCGIQLAAGVNFCPNCGTRVIAPAASTNPGNMVMLVSVGTSNRATAAALLARICGYSDEEALLIVDSAPITVARGLNDAQARYLAQALAEYGIEVSVYDGSGWREWESSSTSVWDQAGGLLASVASALGLLGIGNRISRDMMRPSDYPYRTTGPRPPVFRVNSALRAAPRPPVHRAPPPPRPRRRRGPRRSRRRGPRPARKARAAAGSASRARKACATARKARARKARARAAAAQARPAPQPAARPAPRPASRPNDITRTGQSQWTPRRRNGTQGMKDRRRTALQFGVFHMNR